MTSLINHQPASCVWSDCLRTWYYYVYAATTANYAYHRTKMALQAAKHADTAIGWHIPVSLGRSPRSTASRKQHCMGPDGGMQIKKTHRQCDIPTVSCQKSRDARWTSLSLPLLLLFFFFLSPATPDPITVIYYPPNKSMGKSTLTHLGPFVTPNTGAMLAGWGGRGPGRCKVRTVNKKEASPALKVSGQDCLFQQRTPNFQEKRGLGSRVGCRPAREPAAAFFRLVPGGLTLPATTVMDVCQRNSQRWPQLTWAPAPSWYVIRSRPTC